MSKQVAIVTGASSGIGKEIAKHLHRNGMEVYALARRVEKMNELDDLGIHTMYLDVTNYAGIEDAVNTITGNTGRIDVLVNAAGYGSFGAVEEVALTEGEYEFKVNVFGMMKMIQTVLPIMRVQKSGRIINIGSMDGKVASLLGSWYVGSKFAVEGISDALRLELKEFGINVSVIEPGAIATEWQDIAMDKMKAASTNGPYANLARKTADFFELSYSFAAKPRVVARAVDRAAMARRPKTRYVCGTGAAPMLMLRKMLPDKAFDSFISAAMTCAQKIINQTKARQR